MREPIEGELFSAERPEDLAVPLVRESIQNSLDAGTGEGPVLVRFRLGEVTPSTAEFQLFFGDLVPHLSSAGSGLETPPPRPRHPLRYLIVEDFETSGLGGDPDADEPPPEGSKNNFYSFWRSVGRGDKEREERGRWGLGKTVFPASSTISTFFGATVRQEDKLKLLMGMSVLRNHKVNTTWFKPYGYFANHEADGFPLPLEITGDLSELEVLFPLERGARPGLSVIVIEPYRELSEESLVDQVVAQYFLPIAMGQLVVEVGPVRLDQSYLTGSVSRLQEQGNRFLADLVQLGLWYARKSKDNLPTIEDEDSGQAIESAKEKFDDHEPFAVRVPITVVDKKAGEKASWVTVVGHHNLSKDQQSVVFVRQGLTITNMRVTSPPGTRYMVIAEDSTIVTFLGDAESPAHTLWKVTKRLRQAYVSPGSTITAVRRAADRVHELIQEKQPEIDHSILSRLFPQPDLSQERRPGRRRKQGAGIGENPQPPTDPVTRVVQVIRTGSGFKVRRADSTAALPRRLVIRAAYDTEAGNPFSRYDRLDFMLDRDPVRIEHAGCSIWVSDNRIMVTDIDAAFELTVEGFDTKRDVITDVRVTK